MKGVGIDVIDVKRFVRFRKTKDHLFLTKHFSANEIEYCFSFTDSSEHLAGIFAAKEAVVKAFGGVNITIGSIEIRHTKNGAPVVYVKRKKARGVYVSISHTKKLATAIALRT